jgi:hypothetical protein
MHNLISSDDLAEFRALITPSVATTFDGKEKLLR